VENSFLKAATCKSTSSQSYKSGAQSDDSWRACSKPRGFDCLSTGLDIPSITKTVVERIRAQGDPILANLSLIGAELDDENPVVEVPVAPDDQRKIDAIDWLIFDPSQRCEALKQSNAVARTFLGKLTFGLRVLRRQNGNVFSSVLSL